MLRLLRSLDHSALVEVALVVNVELAEGVLEAEDLALLELGVFSARNALSATVEYGGNARSFQSAARPNVLLELDDVHFGDGLGGLEARVGAEEAKIPRGKVTAWHRLV